jgi:hypothetical protein
MGHMWDETPTIQRWFDAIRAHPVYAEANYHGSLLTEKYPELAAEITDRR